ncbi:MAG: ATP-binding protein, partial [Coriobacteriales bacterium]|nr:ATP-binding protein [Coriobacteriales bacterium]
MIKTREKRFNVTGLCVAGKHYMVDTSAKIERIVSDYIEYGEYFTINKARQFGKTTTFNLLIHRLKDEYFVVRLSFEATESYFESLETFAKGLSSSMVLSLTNRNDGPADAELINIWERPAIKDSPLEDLRERIQDFCTASQKPVVLLIDEVDRASDFAVFSAFLGLLREMYLERESGRTKTFQSVILAGVHDIKNLRKKIRPDSAHSYNSPWNIAADFTIDMSFSAPEIATMLE